ncbi:MAG TPA: hypothetical protein VLK82_10945 [Candidatus Tectomicrobia bacterium]|nr:hypothetical protein [Candidatus Tectomicrobia bacterium]
MRFGTLEHVRHVRRHDVAMLDLEDSQASLLLTNRQTLLRSYSFNGAVRDIFGALLNRAALYPLDLETEGMAHLVEWLGAEEITIYRSVISVFRRSTHRPSSLSWTRCKGCRTKPPIDLALPARLPARSPRHLSQRLASSCSRPGR